MKGIESMVSLGKLKSNNSSINQRFTTKKTIWVTSCQKETGWVINCDESHRNLMFAQKILKLFTFNCRILPKQNE
ncbi:hypothetical protein TYRP_010246 [Tyrophagus putrescentiae]|nr:hypothetical protein TYRP_010246 [Tyrophagus putrescentiae]